MLQPRLFSNVKLRNGHGSRASDARIGDGSSGHGDGASTGLVCAQNEDASGRVDVRVGGNLTADAPLDGIAHETAHHDGCGERCRGCGSQGSRGRGDRDGRDRADCRDESDGVAVRGDGERLPGVVPVLPVQTFAVVVLGEVLEVVEYHPPVLVHHDERDVGKCSLVGCIERRVGGIVCEQEGETCIVMFGERIDHDDMTEELGVFHVERTSQDTHIDQRFHRGADDYVLVLAQGGVVHARTVVVGLEERHLRGDGACAVHHVIDGGEHGGNGFVCDIAFEDGTGDHVLHGAVLVVLHARVHRIYNLGDEVGDSLPGQESLTELVVLDGGFVELLEVHGMERCTNVGNLALEHFLGSRCWVERMRVCEVDENLLDGLAELHVAALEHRPGVVPHLRGDDGETDAVHERVQEGVLVGLIGHDEIADSMEATGIIGNVNGVCHS